MITAIIKSSMFSENVFCKSEDVNLSMYSYSLNGFFIDIVRSGDVVARSDCLNELEYPIGKKWNIHRCYKGKLIDKVIDSDGCELLNIERDYRPGTYSFFNNYLKIDVLNERFSMVTERKQWKLFSPIEVKAFCEGDVDMDLLVISLLLAWFRYEYSSHDQMY
ncbi:hypothetical protein [Hahella chejuensis]|uniref:hypothetical protein n=1 Tax=Hahella chejuensis TaxID=158327 RepID=UPI0011D0FCB5|nr:hypothetical protein [Hahella chejuensis]